MTDQSSCICIVCRKAMHNYLDEGLQPNEGLSFMTKGHYGSTFFDHMDGSYLEICVCDECLTKAAADGLVYRGEMLHLAKYKAEPGGAARGCAPDATGELRIEDFIRKIRDEGWAMATRSYSDLSDSATTFNPEEQFDRDIDERMKEMSKEDAVAKAIQNAYQDFANKSAYEHMQMGDLILKHVASAAIAAADKWDAEQRVRSPGDQYRLDQKPMYPDAPNMGISAGLDSAIQDELDHPPASIMEERK